VYRAHGGTLLHSSYVERRESSTPFRPASPAAAGRASHSHLPMLRLYALLLLELNMAAAPPLVARAKKQPPLRQARRAWNKLNALHG